MRLLAAITVSVLAVVALATTVVGQQAIPSWRLVPELRIGSLDDAPYALPGAQRITVSPSTGSIFISSVGEIRAFDSDGRYLRAFGRRGEGPGEFYGLASLGWAGGSLLAFRHDGRVISFAETGELVRDRQVQATPSGGLSLMGSPVAPMGEGHYLWTYSVGYEMFGPDGLASVPLIRTNGDGEDLVLDQLDRRETGWKAGKAAGWQPLAGGSLYQADPRGSTVIIVHQRPPASREDAAYRVRRLDATGGVVFARTYRFEPKPVPQSYGDSIINSWTQALRNRGDADGAASVRRLVRIPRFQPPITRMQVGVDGSTWLRREDLGAELVAWLVLSPSGDLVGQLRLPPRFEIFHADQEHVWGVEADEVGVLYAVKYRIERPQ